MTQQNAYPRFEAKEWNATGATQFYGRERKRSYIVEVTLSEEIRGDLLQQAVDKALKRLPYYCSTFVRKKGLYYYADHGNAEVMVNEETGEPWTAHTSNPVPFILVNYDPAYMLREGGRLADIAPTLIEMMGMEKPAEMTGESLLIPVSAPEENKP